MEVQKEKRENNAEENKEAKVVVVHPVQPTQREKWKERKTEEGKVKRKIHLLLFGMEEKQEGRKSGEITFPS